MKTEEKGDKMTPEICTHCGQTIEKETKEEAYPEDWLKIILMVSPVGEFHSIGDTSAMERLNRRLNPIKYMDERLDNIERLLSSDKTTGVIPGPKPYPWPIKGYNPKA